MRLLDQCDRKFKFKATTRAAPSLAKSGRRLVVCDICFQIWDWAPSLFQIDSFWNVQFGQIVNFEFRIGINFVYDLICSIVVNYFLRWFQKFDLFVFWHKMSLLSFSLIWFVVQICHFRFKIIFFKLKKFKQIQIDKNIWNDLLWHLRQIIFHFRRLVKSKFFKMAPSVQDQLSPDGWSSYGLRHSSHDHRLPMAYDRDYVGRNFRHYFSLLFYFKKTRHLSISIEYR